VVDVEPGQHVVEGQELAVVEAMKMQNILRAPKNAVVKAVHVVAGANLKNDQMILEYES
jgi:propionyl-CoA carboxylase alpha chain